MLAKKRGERGFVGTSKQEGVVVVNEEGVSLVLKNSPQEMSLNEARQRRCANPCLVFRWRTHSDAVAHMKMTLPKLLFGLIHKK